MHFSDADLLIGLEKEREIAAANGLFYKVRRFVRRDCGRNSVEYAQLRDKAVRKAREDLSSQPALLKGEGE
ncbi:MAG: hypothetical protein JW768_15895 [Chitinispirillaceae bacterium]|nr:hypothetical protein [Chitinispirillaceae bacterium]